MQIYSDIKAFICVLWENKKRNDKERERSMEFSLQQSSTMVKTSKWMELIIIIFKDVSRIEIIRRFIQVLLSLEMLKQLFVTISATIDLHRFDLWRILMNSFKFDIQSNDCFLHLWWERQQSVSADCFEESFGNSVKDGELIVEDCCSSTQTKIGFYKVAFKFFNQIFWNWLIERTYCHCGFWKVNRNENETFADELSAFGHRSTLY